MAISVDAATAVGGFVSPGDRVDIIAARFSGNSQTVRIESTGIVGEFRKKVILVVRNRSNRPTILMREEVPVQ